MNCMLYEEQWEQKKGKNHRLFSRSLNPVIPFMVLWMPEQYHHSVWLSTWWAILHPIKMKVFMFRTVPGACSREKKCRRLSFRASKNFINDNKEFKCNQANKSILTFLLADLAICYKENLKQIEVINFFRCLWLVTVWKRIRSWRRHIAFIQGIQEGKRSQIYYC